MSRQWALDDERGFTLVEVIVTIIVMGILSAIAISIFNWSDVIGSRKVVTATNQVAADLRLANTQATNRLADSTFLTPAGTIPDTVPDEVQPRLEEYPLSTYEVGPAGALAFDWLPEGTRIAAATNIKFMANGSAQVVSGPPADASGKITMTVGLSQDPNEEPNHTIQINTTTSRIKVVP